MDTFERGTLNISSAMKTILNMHSYFRAFFVLALVIILFSCKKEESNDPPPLRTYQDLENDFDAIDISDEGIDDVSLKATSFLTWDVRIISPGIENLILKLKLNEIEFFLKKSTLRPTHGPFLAKLEVGLLGQKAHVQENLILTIFHFENYNF